MGDERELYRDLYIMLFNRITDALRALEEGNPNHAHCLLCQAQRNAEERYISYDTELP